MNDNELYTCVDIDENHEKDRERKERLEQSKKARAKRSLIKDKKARQQQEGYHGNL